MTTLDPHSDDPPGGVLRAGGIEVRLARSEAEVVAAQELRYRVFYEEMSATPSVDMAATRRDFDRFDDRCDHLLALDLSRGSGPEGVVGVYRLIRPEAAVACGGFYTASEYDISPLLANGGSLLELGRSCVDPAYRSRGAMQLLWRGLAGYVFHYGIEVMFGCASFPTPNPDDHALPLTYLRRNHLAPTELRPHARAELYVEMERLPDETVNPRAALAELPPLIKGYLRLGGFVGDGAVVDPQFGTTDVCVIVKTDQISDKYFQHYARTAREAHS